MRKKIFAVAAVCMVAAVIALFILKNKESIYVGTVEATRVDISPRVSSQIEEIFVDEGDRVERGAPLAKLACEEIRLRKDTLDRDYERAKKLLASGTIPKEGYEHVKSEYDDVRLKLSWCDVRSPISATVLDRYREPGEVVSPGTRILSLADLEHVWVYVYVEQKLMSMLKVGDKVAGILPEQDMKRTGGTITHINAEAEFTPKNVQTRKERTRLVYGIKVSFENKEGILKPGMPIEVEFNER